MTTKVLGVAACLLACLVACGEDVEISSAASGGPTGPGGSGGNAAQGGGGNAAQGGSSDACLSTATDAATPVTIRYRNDRPDPLYLSTSQCVDPWRIEAPSGASAPWGVGHNRCDIAEALCPLDCLDIETETLAPGAERVYTWDGHLVDDVDAAANNCAYAVNIGEIGCFEMCQRSVDSPAGSYELGAHAWTMPNASSLFKTVTFDYPATTEVLVAFVPADG